MEREALRGRRAGLDAAAAARNAADPRPGAGGCARADGAIEDWRPEDREFWEATGQAIARRNLWISVPCLLLSFAVWMVWSVVVARLPSVGFNFTTSQLFWLASLPGLSGATLRIFYSFMPAMFGGRLVDDAVDLVAAHPGHRHGLCRAELRTPYWIFLVLALLCGFGGGNFASSMANISFFFPKAEKGNALAINAGLGNLGVSVVQFVVPIAITAGVFGWLGGDPQIARPAPQPPRCGCRTPATCSCRSSSRRPSPPGSAWTTSRR